MFIDAYNETQFSKFAEKHGYELVSLQKRQRKSPMFDVCLRIIGTSVEIDFIATDFEFRTATHRTRGISENLSIKWQNFVGKREGQLYFNRLKSNVDNLSF